MRSDLVDLGRPHDLPRPACRVILLVGPPAAGKTTYAKRHMAEGDILIDFDEIATVMGFDRRTNRTAVAAILGERNRRLFQLSEANAQICAWVTMLAPHKAVREWWRDRLGADVLLIAPSMSELIDRIEADPSRRDVEAEHIDLWLRWYSDATMAGGFAVSGACDASGRPIDPLHPWNRRRY